VVDRFSQCPLPSSGLYVADDRFAVLRYRLLLPFGGPSLLITTRIES
jgi:hypothetical protein